MSPVEPGFQALEQRRGQLDAIRENSARLAEAHLTFSTHGWGEFKLPEAAYFSCTFIEQPNITTGVALDGDLLVPTRFPRVTAGVYRWLQDTKGFYIGAWVFFVVDTQSSFIATTVTSDPGYDLTHYFHFSGVAAKILPAHLLDGMTI
jgi:hypothetical protein